MQKNYEEEFKKKIIRLHIEEGRTIKSLSLEYSISKSAVSYWNGNKNLDSFFKFVFQKFYRA